MIINNVYHDDTVCPECGERMLENNEGFLYCPLCSTEDDES